MGWLADRAPGQAGEGQHDAEVPASDYWQRRQGGQGLPQPVSSPKVSRGLRSKTQSSPGRSHTSIQLFSFHDTRLGRREVRGFHVTDLYMSE